MLPLTLSSQAYLCKYGKNVKVLWLGDFYLFFPEPMESTVGLHFSTNLESVKANIHSLKNSKNLYSKLN